MTLAPITAIYVALHGLLLVVLSIFVVRGRLDGEVSLGDGGSAALRVAQRRQGNFVEYVPLALLMIACVEGAGYGAGAVHALGAALFAARVLHPFGIADEFGLRPPRFIGATVTWLVMVAASGLILWAAIAS